MKKKPDRWTQKLKKAQFDFEDYLESMSQMKKMGGLSSIMGMMPGIGGKECRIWIRKKMKRRWRR